MKITVPAVSFLLASFLWINQAFSEEIYIRYDEGCMHRLEFAYGFTPPNMEYIKYHLMLGENEAIVLEIGPENANSPQSYFSNPTASCGDPVISKELVDKIRNNKAQVFMVRQVGSRYYVSKANNASYFRRDNNGVIYDSWQYQVNSNGGLKVGDNITKKDNAQGIDITYQGTTKYDCADAYKFEMRFSHANNGSYREIFFIPGIGTVEERPTGDPQNIYKLKTFDGKPLDQVLQEHCQKGLAPIAANFLPGASAGTPAASYPGVSAAGAPAGQVVYHEVERGETLYSISRKYNVGVSDLQDWNGLTSNTLSAGTRLQVSPPPGTSNDLAAKGGMTAPAYSTSSSSGSIPNNSWGAGGASLPTATTPPAGGSTLPGMTSTSTPAPTNLPAWRTTNGFHQAKPGETVASLALLYGYTETRFREMNNLGPNDFLKIGQTLKTTDCPPASPTNMTPRGIQQPDNIMGSSVNPYNTQAPQTSNYSGSTTLPGAPVAAGTTITAAAAYTPPPAATPPSSTFDPYGSSVPDFNNLPPIDQEAAATTTTAGTTTLPGGVALPTGTPYPNADYFPPAQNDLQPRGGTIVPGSVPQPQAAPAPAPNTGTFGTPIPSTGPQPGAIPQQAASDPFSASTTAPAYNNNGQAYSSSYNYQTAAVPTANTQSSASYKTTYVVQEGDSIESIAKRFGTTTDRLRAINNLDRNEILIPYKRIYID